MNFTELLKIFEQHYGIKRLADIAKELDVSPQVVNNWKARDYVPYKYIKSIREKNADLKINSEDVFDILKYLSILLNAIKNYYLLILTLTIISSLVTAYYVVYISKPVFVSSAKILPFSESSSSGISSIANQFGVSLGGGGNKQNYFDAKVYPVLLTSRDLLARVLERKFYTERYQTDKSLFEIFSGGHLPKSEDESKLKKVLAINKLKKSIIIEKEKKTSIIKLKIHSFEPVLVAKIASALIDELDLTHKNFKLKNTNESLLFINQRIEQVDIDLKKAEEKLKEFRQNNRLIMKSPSLMLQQERLIREVEVQAQLFITLKSKLELLQIDSLENSSMLTVVEAPEIPIKRVSPKRTKSVLTALILSFAFGIFISFYIQIGFFRESKNKFFLLWNS